MDPSRASLDSKKEIPSRLWSEASTNIADLTSSLLKTKLDRRLLAAPPPWTLLWPEMRMLLAPLSTFSGRTSKEKELEVTSSRSLNSNSNGRRKTKLTGFLLNLLSPATSTRLTLTLLRVMFTCTESVLRTFSVGDLGPLLTSRFRLVPDPLLLSLLLLPLSRRRFPLLEVEDYKEMIASSANGKSLSAGKWLKRKTTLKLRLMKSL